MHLDRCTRTGLTRATAGPFSFRGLPSADNVPLLQETHKASRDFYRKYGWFRPGAARFVPVNIATPQSWSTLAALTVDGLISWKITRLDKSTGPAGQDTMAFLSDFCDVVLPFIQPYPAARSVIIADNVRACVSLFARQPLIAGVRARVCVAVLAAS